MTKEQALQILEHAIDFLQESNGNKRAIKMLMALHIELATELGII